MLRDDHLPVGPKEGSIGLETTVAATHTTHVAAVSAAVAAAVATVAASVVQCLTDEHATHKTCRSPGRNSTAAVAAAVCHPIGQDRVRRGEGGGKGEMDKVGDERGRSPHSEQC